MSGDPDVITAIRPDELDPPGKLPFRIVHALNAAGIKTYSQLSNCTKKTLLTTTGIPSCDVPIINSELFRRNLRPLEGDEGQAANGDGGNGDDVLSAQQASLRDQFAMAALTGLVLHQDRLGMLKGGYRELSVHEACVDAYALADEMLKARKRVKA